MIHLDEKFIYQSVNGNVVTFETNTEQPLRNLEVDIQAEQDLHGYDYPWPGGSGKNKINADGFVGNKCTKNSDGSYTLEFVTTSVANRSTAYCPLNVSPGTYVFSATCGTLLDENNYISMRFVVDGTTQSGVRFYDGDETQIGGRISRSVTVPTYTTSLAIQLYFANFTGAQTGDSFTFSDVMLEVGETLTDYVPYSNICPITGCTKMNLTYTGKNLFNSSVNWTNGSRGDSGEPVSNQSKHTDPIHGFMPNTTYTISGTIATSNVAFRLYYLKADETWISRTETIGDSYLPYTFVTPDNCGAIQLQISQSLSPTDIQIEAGTSASTYEPYVGSTRSLFGKNLLNINDLISAESGSTGGYTFKHKLVLSLKANTYYTLSTSYSGTNNVLYFNGATTNDVVKNNHPVTKTDSNGQLIILLYDRTGIEEFENKEVTVQLEEAQSASSYEPYVGTICSGTLNVLTGVLTLNYGIKTIDGNTSFTDRISNQNRVYFKNSDMMSSKNDESCKCDTFKIVATSQNASEPSISIGADNQYVYLNGVTHIDPSITNMTTLSAWLTTHNITFTYPLETPITYQLTAQQIATLIGKNTLFIDTKNVMSCEYPVSTGDPYDNYFNAIRNENRQHIRVTFTLDSLVFEEKDLTNECRIVTYMNPEIDLTFGTAFSSETTLYFLPSQKTNQMNWSHEFTVEFGIENEYGTDWTQVGIFSGKRPVRDSFGVITLVAYDRMQRLDKPVNDLWGLISFPCTLQQLYDEMCDFVSIESVAGDEIADVMSRTVTADFRKDEIVTCRDLLRLIAEANCCYARVTTDGYLQLKWFDSHTDDFTLERNYIFELESTNLQQFDGKTWGEIGSFTWKQLRNFKWRDFFNAVVPFFINRILIIWEENGDTPRKEILHPPEGQQPTALTWNDADLLTWDEFDEYIWDEAEGKEVTGVIYEMYENPFINYATEADIRAHLQLIINRLKLFRMYYVAAVSAVGNWIIEAGDVVSLELEDQIVTYPIYSRTLIWNGSCECDYESTGNIIRGTE